MDSLTVLIDGVIGIVFTLTLLGGLIYLVKNKGEWFDE
jgi:hypothetical protein